MLNKQPIFVNGFARGGTNILMNLLLSHPRIAMPMGELQKVIYGKALGETKFDRYRKKLFYELPLSYILGKSYFSQSNTGKRRELPQILKQYIDFILYQEKLNATKHEGHNIYAYPNVKYTQNDLKKARLVCKNISSLVYLTEIFQEIYPDATFVCVIRDGLALLESHLRRGAKLESFIEFFHEIATEMLACRDRYSNYIIVKYEDIIDAPLEMMEKIYKFANLNLQEVKQVRFQVKSTVKRDGSADNLGKRDRALVWYELENIKEHIQSGVNTNQINKLSNEQIDKFIKKNKEVMEKLGYNY